MTQWPTGTGLISLDSVDSTSTEAQRRAAAGEPLPFWLISAEQTNARARRGRQWSAAPGNFMASVMIRTQGELAQAALRSFTASLALYDALDQLLEIGPELSLKWPNDVLYQGKKLAGILLESTALRGEVQLCIGIGVNLASAPDPKTLERQAMAPVSLAGAISPDYLLQALAASFAKYEDMLNTHGFAPIRDEWLSKAARRGEVITARLSDREFVGRFETVDDTGAIVLHTNTGAVHLPAADVHF